MSIRSLIPTRRSFLAAVVVACFGLTFSVSAAEQTKKVLFLTKSAGFQHPVIARDPKDPAKLAYAEQILTEMGAKNGFEVTVTKDADVFNDPETYKKYDVFAFYTTEDLTKPSDKQIDLAPPVEQEVTDPKTGEKRMVKRRNPNPQLKLVHTEKAMSPEGKKMFLEAIANGKGFIGFHCASDTFHSGNRNNPDLLRPIDVKDPVDPYIAMVGGEFVGHGSQQKATMRVADKNFPGIEGLEDFGFQEEWYSLKNLAPDMHVILVQETTTMVNERGQKEPIYNRAPYPATWVRMEGKGRIFYTSMGHREDVWTNPIFQKVVIAGLNWAAGNAEADVKPNMEQVASQAGPAAQAK
jgi:uncharacterized protein